MKKTIGIQKEIPTLLQTVMGAVAGNVASRLIKKDDIAKMGKYSGLIVGGAGIGIAMFLGKNPLFKNFGLGMATSGITEFTSSMIDIKPKTSVVVQGLERRLNGEVTAIGSLNRINDTGYKVINNDNIANV